MKRAKFVTNTYGAFPELDKRTNQEVTVLRQLTNEECDLECQPMFEVQFSDEFTAHVFGDELTPIE